VWPWNVSPHPRGAERGRDDVTKQIVSDSDWVIVSSITGRLVSNSSATSYAAAIRECRRLNTVTRSNLFRVERAEVVRAYYA
jgi:hypothetical protein